MKHSDAAPYFPNAEALELAERAYAYPWMSLSEKTVGRIFAVLPPEERPGWLHERVATAALNHHSVEITRSEARTLVSRLLNQTAINERAIAH